MFLRSVERLSITTVFLIVAVANASPTISSQAAVLTPTNICSVDNPAQILRLPGNVIEVVDTQLVAFGREFLQPSASSTDLGSTTINSIKPLPAVPATILMVLSGFLCVSLVRDRKVWLAVFGSLLWAGQSGIQAIPQLALRISQRSHIEQQSSACLYCVEDSHGLYSERQGTRYIGLLRHLEGIPGDGNAFSSLSATIDAPTASYPLLKCVAVEFEQFICFSPAFIFNNLPRGPPNLT